MNLGPMEIAFILGLVLLLFGPDKLPQLAKTIGKATREYQKALKDVTDSGNSLISDFKEESKSNSSDIMDDDKIIENAKKLGIETSGKTIDQIIDEILEKTK
ncbi:MAG: twin-arginine translocase TatA/TatE family subunit [Candidatus Thorarchaeota archaeon]